MSNLKLAIKLRSQKQIFWLTVILISTFLTVWLTITLTAIVQLPSYAQINQILNQTIPLQATKLRLTYPPQSHQTLSNRIFLIGSAPPVGDVLLNGKPINRSPNGHFAPSVPLNLGINELVLQYQNQALPIKIERIPKRLPLPTKAGFIPASLYPLNNISRLPAESVCFAATATPKADVTVAIAGKTIKLLPKNDPVQLPDNSAVLTNGSQEIDAIEGEYTACVALSSLINSSLINADTKPALPLNLGKPVYTVRTTNTAGETSQVTQIADGQIEILNPEQLPIGEIITAEVDTRTGPSTDYSRLTPLPQHTRFVINGKEGNWVRLTQGFWTRAGATKELPPNTPTQAVIRGVRTKTLKHWTELRIPLEVPVPFALLQEDNSMTLTLYNATAQTDTILANADPVLAGITWQQVEPQRVVYRLKLKSAQAWGYKTRYDGKVLVLSLKHPPRLPQAQPSDSQPLQGIKILLDAGHGGPEDSGTVSPTGYPEKSATLVTTLLTRQALIDKGATVILTRDRDMDVELSQRVNLIDQNEPAIAISLHYNALPDNGDAENTVGMGAFWYHPQAQGLAEFINGYLTKELNRPNYGVFWNNLALTRPTVAPSILLEFGFMIHPTEWEWIANPQEQERRAHALADGITQWLYQNRI
ncbi:MAG: N-acetylmuramoyl-L-alanine amidase [Pseudanabaena sp. ELA607]